MAPPTWVTGQVLSASDVNNWFIPLVATKTADQSVTSSTTFVNDSELVLTPAINCTYEFRMYIDYEGASNAGFLKWGFVVPTGAVLRYQGIYQGTGNSAHVVDTFQATDQPASYTAGAGVLCGVTLAGSYITGSTSGNLTFKWAQQASNATSTIVHAQSFMMLRRIS